MAARRRGPGPTVLSAVFVCAVLVPGCAEVDARGDFNATGELIKARTGSEAVFDPAADQQAGDQAASELVKDGLTVDEAVNVALLLNPALQAAYQDIGISRADLVDAGLPSNPLLFFSARFPDSSNPVNLTTSLTQSLFELLLIPSRTRAGEARLEASRLEVARQAVELAGQVKREAYQVLALERAAGVAEEHLALTEGFLGIAERRLAAGEGDIIEVNLARAGVLEVKREALLTRRDLKIRRVALGRLMGLMQDLETWNLVGDLPQPDALPDLADLESLAQEQRLDVQVARLQVQAADEEAAAQGLFWAQGLELGVERESESSYSLTGPTLQVALPLWNQNQPAAARAGFLAIQARKHLADLQDGVRTDVRQAEAALESNGDLVDLFNGEILPQARASLASATRAWQSGEHDILVVVVAQGTLLTQRREYVSVLRDYAAALADLELAAGGRLAGPKAPAPGPVPQEGRSGR